MKCRKTRFEVVPLAEIAPLLGDTQLAGVNKAPQPARILSVTFDRMLGATREMLFTRAGFQVKTVSAIGHAVQLCAAEAFDLIVIGHSIPIQQRELLLKEVRRQCATPTLALCRHGEPPLTSADHVFDSADSPGLLLETVVEILKSRDLKPGSGQPDEPAAAVGARENDTVKKITGAKNLDRSTV
jgi:DNA-binding NtrC family response regulator